MLTLYDSALSANCYKVRLLLAKLGLPYERVAISVSGARDAERRAELLAGNPRRTVPTLVLDDGTVLGESLAILLWLSEGSPYLPADRLERQRVLEWLAFEQNNLEPSIAVLRYALTLAEQPPAPPVEAFLRARGERVLRTMEDWLSAHDYFVGERETVADIALYGYTHVAGDARFVLDAYPRVQAWMERMRGERGYVAMDA